MRRVQTILFWVFLSLVRSQDLVNIVSQEDAILNQEAILRVEAILKQEAIMNQEAVLKVEAVLKQNAHLKQEAIKRENSWLAGHANQKSRSSGDNHSHRQLLHYLNRLYYIFSITTN